METVDKSSLYELIKLGLTTRNILIILVFGEGGELGREGSWGVWDGGLLAILGVNMNIFIEAYKVDKMVVKSVNNFSD